MKIINQDILNVTEGIIVHQTNCCGVMGAGLAKNIKEKFPKVFQEYRSFTWSLGKIQIVVIEKSKLYVCNLFGQNSYGRSSHRYTDYNAVRRGFKELKAWRDVFCPDLNIYAPYKMGCALGNGNWNIYSKIIEEECPNVIVCKLENGK